MSTETTEEQVDELENQSTTTETEVTEESQSEGGESGESTFDASTYEVSFQLPAGTLKDAKSEDEAIAIIRSYVDRTLIANAGNEGFIGGADVPEKPAAKGGKAEKETLEQRIERIEREREEDRRAFQAQRVENINQRVLAKVDTWDSPKYGTRKSRTYKQLQSLKELRQLAVGHTQSLAAQGQVVSDEMIEAILDRARIFHDEDFKPGAPKKAAAEKPLGTPGGHNGDKAGKAPGNIHEALMRSPR